MTTHKLWAIVLAAGQGTRIARSGTGEKKQFLNYEGVPLFWHSIRTLSRIAVLDGIILVFPEEEFTEAQETVSALRAQESTGIALHCVTGGSRRQDSVYHALQTLPRDCDRVLIHDAARPFFSPSLVTLLLDKLTPDTGGVIPACPVTDTVKEIRDDRVVQTLERSTLAAVQTPQLFHRDRIVRAHDEARIQDWKVTDDASMVEQMGDPVSIIPGETGNIKITHPEDLTMLASPAPLPIPVTGFGYDVHRYNGTRPMILGGIPIPGGPSIKAHSDGDVLIHALCDALLGCLGQGDIGDFFPDTDEKYANMPSTLFLAEVLDKALAAGFTITHADLTIVAQIPKITPFKAQIKKNIAALMGLPPRYVNIKATTEEGLGFTGKKEGIKAVAVVTGYQGKKIAALKDR